MKGPLGSNSNSNSNSKSQSQLLVLMRQRCSNIVFVLNKYIRGDLRWVSLALFVVSHVILTIGLRLEVLHSDPENPCISSTVVCLSEMCKLLLSCVAVYWLDCNGTTRDRLSSFWKQITHAFLDEAADLLKLCVPAILYTIQNNFQYVIETSTLFVILYQFKVITTAIFYQTMLDRPIRRLEWVVLVMLTFGIGLMQSSQEDIHLHHASNRLGIACVVLACLTSGFAGVYFEKTLMQSKSSIWMINLQMSLVSTSISMFACLIEDTESIARKGFFTGYEPMTWMIIFLQAVAGLSIAAVCRYADNIYKGFAYGWGVIVSCGVDYAVFSDYTLNADFTRGSLLVVASSAVYMHLHEVYLPRVWLLFEQKWQNEDIDIDIDADIENNRNEDDRERDRERGEKEETLDTDVLLGNVSKNTVTTTGTKKFNQKYTMCPMCCSNPLMGPGPNKNTRSTGSNCGSSSRRTAITKICVSFRDYLYETDIVGMNRHAASYGHSKKNQAMSVHAGVGNEDVNTGSISSNSVTDGMIGDHSSPTGGAGGGYALTAVQINNSTEQGQGHGLSQSNALHERRSSTLLAISSNGSDSSIDLHELSYKLAGISIGNGSSNSTTFNKDKVGVGSGGGGGSIGDAYQVGKTNTEGTVVYTTPMRNHTRDKGDKGGAYKSKLEKERINDPSSSRTDPTTGVASRFLTGVSESIFQTPVYRGISSMASAAANFFSEESVDSPLPLLLTDMASSASSSPLREKVGRSLKK